MKKLNLSKVLFYSLYTLIIFYYMCGKIVGIQPVRDIIFSIVPPSLIILILFQSKKYNLKSLLIIVLLVLLTFVTYIITDSNELFLTLLFIIASKNIELDKLIKYDLFIKMILTLMLFSLSGLGYTTDEIKYRNGVTRYSWGFGHPNALGAFLFSMCVDLIYLKGNKLKIKDYVFILVSFFICTYVCNSRGAQLGIIIIVVLNLFYHKIKDNKLLKKMIPLIPTFCFILCLLFVIGYINNNELSKLVNTITSERIRMASEFYEYYGISLFGNRLEFLGMTDKSKYLTILDISYLNILIQYGIIVTFIICISFYNMLKKIIKNNKNEAIICILAICMYGLMEIYIFMIAYNALLLYFGNMIYFKRNGGNEN